MEKNAGQAIFVAYGKPALDLQDSMIASVALKWLATGGLAEVVGVGQL